MLVAGLGDARCVLSGCARCDRFCVPPRVRDGRATIAAAPSGLPCPTNVEAAQEHGINVGEVNREELAPGRPSPSGRGLESRIRQDPPESRGGHGPSPTNSPGSICSPSGDSRGPSAARGPESLVRWVVGLVIGAGSRNERDGPGGRGLGQHASSWGHRLIAVIRPGQVPFKS